MCHSNVYVSLQCICVTLMSMCHSNVYVPLQSRYTTQMYHSIVCVPTLAAGRRYTVMQVQITSIILRRFALNCFKYGTATL